MSAQMSMVHGFPKVCRSIAACTSNAYSCRIALRPERVEPRSASSTLSCQLIHLHGRNRHLASRHHLCGRKHALRHNHIPVRLLGPFSQIMGAVRALPSKFGRRSGPCHGPCQIMALREHPSNFTGLPGPYYPPLGATVQYSCNVLAQGLAPGGG